MNADDNICSKLSRKAIGVIEFAHLQLLRQQPIELQTIAPLHTEGMTAERTTGTDLETIQSLELGQWFAVDEGKGEHQRVQLFLKLSQEQQLQFANKAGRKALQLSYENFCKLLANGKARTLHNGASFSRCLAVAAGIESTEDLEALIALEAPQKARLEQAEAESAERERQEAERIKRGQEEAERLEREQLEEKQTWRQHEEAERILRERQEAARAEREQQEADRTRREQQEAERVLLEQQRAERIKRQQEAEQILREQQEAGRAQREQQETEKAQHEHSEPERDQRARLETERAQREQRMAAQGAAGGQQTSANQQQIETADSPGNLNAEEDEIHISMGTWLGFHDGDTPLMAKLAVHDTVQDSFIFVNREGIKMRSLNKRELFSLINNNLVEILEARSNFREQVTRARKDLNQ
jgi:chemotaxis protein histidine kinase CheA